MSGTDFEARRARFMLAGERYFAHLRKPLGNSSVDADRWNAESQELWREFCAANMEFFLTPPPPHQERVASDLMAQVRQLRAELEAAGHE